MTQLSNRAVAGSLVSLFDKAQLSPALRRVSRYVISNPHDAMFLTAAELAERVGVSQPSVSRMVQALGYETYVAFQEELRSLVLASPHKTTTDSAFRKAIANEITNLEALATNIDSPGSTDQIHNLAKDFMASVPLVVTASRISAPLGSYFEFLSSKIHPDVRYVTELETAADRLFQARKNGAKWILAFLLPRYSSSTVETLSIAKQLGYNGAVVVDRPLRLLNDLADEVIYAPTGRVLAFDSYVTAMVVSTIILDAMCDARPDITQDLLEGFEDLAHRYRIFRDE